MTYAAEVDRLAAVEDRLRAGDVTAWPAWEAVRDRLARYVPQAIPPGIAGVRPLRFDEALAPGTEVLVLQEGGAGDTLMCARYARALADAGALVRWQSPPELAPLLRTAPGMHRVLDRPTAVGSEWRWVRALSLPARFGPAAGAPVPYLRVSPPWRRWGWPRRIGVRATSGPLTPGGVDRNLPPALAADLTLGLRRRGFEVVDLDLPAGTSWAITARLVRSCRVVISVDTGVAHLAGSLGADLRVILNERADWRWGTGDRTPWYPTAGLFRAVRGDWVMAVLLAINDL